MIRLKPHLENLYRTSPEDKFSRKDYLKLDMNEGVPGLPKGFIKRIFEGIDADFLSAYPEYKPLIRKIARHNGLKPENICLSNGSDAAIKYIFDAYISPGDKVLLTNPTFAMYPVYCKMFNAHPIIVDYHDDLGFPMEGFIKKLTKNIRMAVVVNPNNPTGSIIKHNGLISIIDKASRNNTIVIVDEAYFYFYPDTIIDSVKKYKNLIILRTFSKLCGLACVRIGYAVSCPEIIDGLRKVKLTFDVNALGVMFAEEIMDNPVILNKLVKRSNAGKGYLMGKLSKAAISYIGGNANFVLIKCDEKVKEITEKLAREGILVASEFNQRFLKDYIRVTIGDKKTMKSFFSAFAKIWERMKR